MRAASYQQSSYLDRPPLRRRLTSLSLAVAANLLLLLLLLHLSPPFSRPEPRREPLTIDLAPDRPAEPDPAATVSKRDKAAGGRAPRKAASAKKAEAPPLPPPETPPPPLNMIQLSHDEFAAADIGRIRSSRGATDPGTGGQGGAGNDAGAGDAAGAGTGPGGEKLYYAEWYREPTNAEISGYLPANGQRSGWGEVACRTVSGFRVEDCAELAESPRGSGFSRAVRQAAWQFRVRPPRIGGRALVGAWVRIRVTYGVTKED